MTTLQNFQDHLSRADLIRPNLAKGIVENLGGQAGLDSKYQDILLSGADSGFLTNEDIKTLFNDHRQDLRAMLEMLSWNDRKDGAEALAKAYTKKDCDATDDEVLAIFNPDDFAAGDAVYQSDDFEDKKQVIMRWTVLTALTKIAESYEDMISQLPKKQSKNDEKKPTQDWLIKEFKDNLSIKSKINLDFRRHQHIANNYGNTPTMSYDLAVKLIDRLYEWANSFVEQNEDHYPNFGGFEYNTQMSCDLLRSTSYQNIVKDVCYRLHHEWA